MAESEGFEPPIPFQVCRFSRPETSPSDLNSKLELLLASEADTADAIKQLNGGERGIRTPDTLSGMPVFKTGAINHSASSPRAWDCFDCTSVTRKWHP